MSRFAALLVSILVATYAIAAASAPVESASSAATSPPPPRHWHLGAEVDPLPFFAHGYSAHVATKPARLPRLRLTLGSFGLRHEPASESPNAGWSARQRALEASAQYTFLAAWHGGLWGGLYVFAQHWTYTRSDTTGSVSGNWLTPAPAAGFQLMPWKSGPYVVPWAALGIPLGRRDRELAEHTYEEPTLFPVIAVHVGYEFEL